MILSNYLSKFDKIWVGNCKFVRDHICDTPNRISSWATQFLFGQVGPLIIGLSQLLSKVFQIWANNLK
jgi:hypothetical protein